ncbi:SEL1 protein [Enteropsectra breve]|nr:SEL1 protein [Enteropsectra breve]
MRSLLKTLLAAAPALAGLTETLFQDLDVKKACALPAVTHQEHTYKYFLIKRFENDSKRAMFYVLNQDSTNGQILLLLARLSLKKSTLNIADDKKHNILKLLSEEISTTYIENKYLFKDVENIRTFDNKAMRDVLTNIWTKNSTVIKRFFMYLEMGMLSIFDVIEELKFLCQIGEPKAYGLLGDAYYYGNGVTTNIDRAMEYYLAGKIRGDVYSSVGIGRVCQFHEPKDLKRAAEEYAFSAKKQFYGEALYNHYLILKAEGFQKVENLALANGYLKSAASHGYLPAVATYAAELSKSLPAAYTAHSFGSVIGFAPLIMEHARYAFAAYQNKEYKKAVLYYLYLAEFNNETALLNSIYLLENHTLLDNQDEILYGLYKEASKTHKEYYKKVGDCMYYGRGTKRTRKGAMAYYLSSMAYSDEGLYNVARMHEYGEGIPKNIRMAMQYIFMEYKSNSSYLVFLYARIRIVLKRYFSVAVGSTLLVGIATLYYFTYKMCKK